MTTIHTLIRSAFVYPAHPWYTDTVASHLKQKTDEWNRQLCTYVPMYLWHITPTCNYGPSYLLFFFFGDLARDLNLA